MRLDEIERAAEIARKPEQDITPGDGRLIRAALLHLHAILTAPLPDMAEIEARAGALLKWNDGDLPEDDGSWPSIAEARAALESDVLAVADLIEGAAEDVPRLLTALRSAHHGIAVQARTIREQAAEIAALRARLASRVQK